MLIEFSVENFRSIKVRQTLSMAANQGSEHRDTHLFQPALPGVPALVRSAAIYGPNASGKTNLIKALQAMQTIVIGSTTKLQRGEEIPVTPYLFSQETVNAPSTFEVVFIHSGVRYQFGFSASRERIHEEWLFAYPKGRVQRWYHRVFDPGKSEYEWQLGDKLQGQKQLWKDATRANALFLSTAIQLNSDQLKPVFDWFAQTLKVMTSIELGQHFTLYVCSRKDLSDNKRKDIVDLLQLADFAVEDFSVEERSFSESDLPPDIPESLQKTLVEQLNTLPNYRTQIAHSTDDGNLAPLDLEDESTGTRKFFFLAGPCLASLEMGNILCIDELNDNLHPLLVEFLVKLFHAPSTNPGNAQLVFTTHETSILNQDMFRRDQIWFCDKGRGQATTLYPLTDFHPRKEQENLERSYLSGRYGALPYFQKVSADME